MTPEKEIAIFEQNCQDFRSLNEIMWRVPVIVITLTGGLWFGVGSLELSIWAKRLLLILSGISNIIFVLVLFRLRYIMNRILKTIKSYQNQETSMAYMVVFLFSLILLFSSFISLIAACKVEFFFGKG